METGNLNEFSLRSYSVPVDFYSHIANLAAQGGFETAIILQGKIVRNGTSLFVQLNKNTFFILLCWEKYVNADLENLLQDPLFHQLYRISHIMKKTTRKQQDQGAHSAPCLFLRLSDLTAIG